MSSITGLKLRNFGIIPEFNCDHFSAINLIIGENGTGKTFFLKAMYSAVRALEEYKRGDDIRSINEVLSEKLRWTFQVDKLGDIVTRAADSSLTFDMILLNSRLIYQFTRTTTSKVTNASASEHGNSSNSVFIPAKEVLSLFPIIFKSREVDRSFGFDDTYYDLAKALSISPSRGKNFTVFSEARKRLNNIVDGKVDYDDADKKWYFKNTRGQKFSINATSEGVKKISIMDRLLANGYLSSHSVIFIDEIESALHPSAVCDFIDLISDIADKMGIQFFISTHSYFVIKKLALVARKRQDFVSCISLSKNEDHPYEICDLYDGMPNNSIIDTSIRLYEQEIEEGL